MRSAILVPLTTLVFPMVAFGSFAGIPCCAAVGHDVPMIANVSSGSYADNNLEKHWVCVFKMADPSPRVGSHWHLFSEVLYSFQEVWSVQPVVVSAED